MPTPTPTPTAVRAALDIADAPCYEVIDAAGAVLARRATRAEAERWRARAARRAAGVVGDERPAGLEAIGELLHRAAAQG